MLSWMWSERYWLPENVTWDTLRSSASIRYPQVADLKYTIYYGLLMLLVRLVFETFVVIPIGHALGYSSRRKSLLSKIGEHLYFGFASKSRTKRVLECSFRASFYTLAFVYGLVILWNESWLTDVKDCWRDYPHHNLTTPLWWYYILETAFYWSLIFASVFDVKRSDFRELMLHHVVTISLLSISWTINMVRVGTLVLLSHDLSDVLLEVGKMTRYGKNVMTTNIIFVVFLGSWIVARLGFFPFVVLRSALLDAPPLIQPDYRWENLLQPPYMPRMIIGMLLCLQALHLFWTIIIGRIVHKTLSAGQAEDVRSDSEEEEPVESTPKKDQ
jgi:hypothetical protein